MSYKYSADWFTGNIPKWQAIVVPHLKSIKRPIKALEIGVFEGRSALWTLENILTHPKSQMWLVDNWTRKSVNSKKTCWHNFMHNMHIYKKLHPDVPEKKVSVCKGKISTMLRNSPEISSNKFDFIYIDVHGDSTDILEQCVLAWDLLSNEGILVIDDYTSSVEHDGSCLKQGIDAFLDIYATRLKVKHMGWQVYITKRTHSLRRKPCQSEYYK